MKNTISKGLLAGLTAGAMILSIQAGSADKTLDIYWPDMEGGGGTLLVTPAGESVLIDTGVPGERDPGRIHKVAATVAGLKKIDFLVTTHFDIDHFGGAADLSKLIPIGRVYDFGLSNSVNAQQTGRMADLFKAYLEFKADQRSIIQPGELLPLRQAANSPKLVLRCLASRQQFVKPRPDQTLTNTLSAEATLKAKDTSDNANSVVLLLEFGPFKFFDGADLTWNLEGQLVCPINLVGTIDVFQVDHHGFDLSNNPILIRSLAPTVSVMVNSAQKGGDAGTVTTLKNLASLQTNYQLHRNGRPTSANAPDEFIANLAVSCNANAIQCSVAPDAKSYTVTIPGTGHKRTFPTRQ